MIRRWISGMRFAATISRGMRSLRGFAREKRGVAAIEFAFIAPLMLAFYFLTMEFSQGIETSKKVGRVASLVGDLVTQSPTASPGELDAIMMIGEAVLQPYNRSRPTITVTAIQVSDDGENKITVAWSRRYANGSHSRPYSPGSAATLPQDLISPGAFFIRADAELPYAPVLTWSDSAKTSLGLMGAFDEIDMGERYYMRPRVSRKIPCDTC